MKGWTLSSYLKMALNTQTRRSLAKLRRLLDEADLAVEADNHEAARELLTLIREAAHDSEPPPSPGSTPNPKPGGSDGRGPI